MDFIRLTPTDREVNPPPISKIRGLLAKAASANQAEAKAAALRAHALMSTWGLTWKDVEPGQPDDEKTAYDSGFAYYVKAACVWWRAEGLAFEPYQEPVREKPRPRKSTNGQHVNPITGETYRGSHNLIALEKAMMKGCWYDRQWAGFHQWPQKGRRVSAGQHGTLLYVPYTDKDTGTTKFFIKRVWNVAQTQVTGSETC